MLQSMILRAKLGCLLQADQRPLGIVKLVEKDLTQLNELLI